MSPPQPAHPPHLLSVAGTVCCLFVLCAATYPSPRGSPASSAMSRSFPFSPTSRKLTFGVILPNNNTYYWSLAKTRFAVEFAMESIERRQLLPGWQLQALYRDSNCSDTDGPLEAIEMYTSRTVSVFLGPACNYAVAPIARFTKRWEIPVITAGALVKAFENKEEYRLLTRLMGSYVEAAEAMTEMCKQFQWRQIGMLYHDLEELGSRSDCFFIAEALFFAVTPHSKAEPWYTKFDEDRVKESEFKDILLQARLNTRSKRPSTCRIFRVLTPRPYPLK